MVYHPPGLTKSKVFFFLLEKGEASFDEIDYFLKRKLGIGKGKGLDTIKDVLWSLISSNVIVCDKQLKNKADRTIEKSFFSVRDSKGLHDFSIIYLNLYTWGKEHAKKFQRSAYFKDKAPFNLEDLQKIISSHAEPGFLPDDYSFSAVLSKLPLEDPRKDMIYFYCESTENIKYRKIRNIILNNLQIIGNGIRKNQPLHMKLLSKLVQIDYTISEWDIPIFRHFKKRLKNSPDFAMSFYRVIAEFLEETNYNNLSISQRLLRSPQGLQQLWATEIMALDSRLMYHQHGAFSLWSPETPEEEMETARRIRFSLKDDDVLANSKIGIVSLFVIFLTLHGTVGEQDRAAIFSDIGFSEDDFQMLLDSAITFPQLANYENVRCIKEEEWRTERLPLKRKEIDEILSRRNERLLRDPKKSHWTKEEAYALCMKNSDVSIEHCLSLILPSSGRGYAIIRE